MIWKCIQHKPFRSFPFANEIEKTGIRFFKSHDCRKEYSISIMRIWWHVVYLPHPFQMKVRCFLSLDCLAPWLQKCSRLLLSNLNQGTCVVRGRVQLLPRVYVVPIVGYVAVIVSSHNCILPVRMWRKRKTLKTFPPKVKSLIRVDPLTFRGSHILCALLGTRTKNADYMCLAPVDGNSNEAMREVGSVK